jgi:hypothetical protein
MFYVWKARSRSRHDIYDWLVHLYREEYALWSDARAEGRESAALCGSPPRVNSVESYIEADGLKTFYVKAGSGFPVVMFHGAAPGASAQVNWQLNIEPLAAAALRFTLTTSRDSARVKIPQTCRSSIELLTPRL